MIRFEAPLFAHGGFDCFLVQANNRQEATRKAYIQAERKYCWTYEWWIDDIIGED